MLMWGAAIFGFVAAGLWYKASTVIIKEGDPKAKGGVFINGVDVSSTAYEQGRSNKFAAIATGVAVALLPGASRVARPIICTISVRLDR